MRARWVMAWPRQSIVPSDSRLRYFSTWPAATLPSPSSQRALRPCLVAFVFFLPGCHVWIFLPGPATWHRLGNSNSLFVPSKRIVTSLRNQDPGSHAPFLSGRPMAWEERRRKHTPYASGRPSPDTWVTRRKVKNPTLMAELPWFEIQRETTFLG